MPLSVVVRQITDNLYYYIDFLYHCINQVLKIWEKKTTDLSVWVCTAENEELKYQFFPIKELGFIDSTHDHIHNIFL